MLCHHTYHALFIIARVSFELKPQFFVVILEIYMDIIYLVDMFRCFTEPYVQNDGKIIDNRRKIAIQYLKTWFIPDLYAFYPLAYLRYISKWEDGNIDPFQMFWAQNFERLNRLYKFMLLFQISRARLTMRYFQDLIKEFNIRVEYQELFVVFLLLGYLIHMAGCLWYASHYGDIYSYINWITQYGIKDESMLVKYIYSIYWATVTCTTVGYGDILPMNGYELMWAMIIICFGVAVFSYILSDLSSKFSDITKSYNINQEKITQIDQLDKKFNIGNQLMEKLLEFFQNHNTDTHLENNKEMSLILKALPSSLKTHMAKFMYQDAILIHRFLQDRDDAFYSHYLEELQVERFSQSDLIAQAGTQPQFVLFIMNGVVKNNSTGKFYEAGHMINHDSIVRKIDIIHDFVAETEVVVLKYEKQVFEQIMDTFPDFYEDIMDSIHEKEQIDQAQKKIDQQMQDTNLKGIIA